MSHQKEQESPLLTFGAREGGGAPSSSSLRLAVGVGDVAVVATSSLGLAEVGDVAVVPHRRCRYRGWCGCLSSPVVVPLGQHPHLLPRAVARRLGGGAGNIIETSVSRLERGRGVSP